MENYLKKLSSFCLSIFVLGIIWTALNPYANYSNNYLEKKLQFISKNNFDIIFIGSSKVNNQVDAFIFDSIITGKSHYNLGANASFNLENFNTIERILQQEKLPKIIVLELQEKMRLSKKNITAPRSYNPYNWSNFNLALFYHWNETQYIQMLYDGMSYVFNVFHFNKNDSSTSKLGIKNVNIIENRLGFFPLDDDPNPDVLQRHEDLLKDTLIISKRENSFEKHLPKKPNLALVKKYKEIQEKCNAKNIQFILFIPAPAEPEAKDLIAFKNELNIPILYAIDPTKNPEYYRLKNRWDYGHLNNKGASIFSKKYAQLLKVSLDSINYSNN